MIGLTIFSEKNTSLFKNGLSVTIWKYELDVNSLEKVSVVLNDVKSNSVLFGNPAN